MVKTSLFFFVTHALFFIIPLAHGMEKTSDSEECTRCSIFKIQLDRNKKFYSQDKECWEKNFEEMDKELVSIKKRNKQLLEENSRNIEQIRRSSFNLTIAKSEQAQHEYRKKKWRLAAISSTIILPILSPYLWEKYIKNSWKKFKNGTILSFFKLSC